MGTNANPDPDLPRADLWRSRTFRGGLLVLLLLLAAWAESSRSAKVIDFQTHGGDVGWKLAIHDGGYGFRVARTMPLPSGGLPYDIDGIISCYGPITSLGWYHHKDGWWEITRAGIAHWLVIACYLALWAGMLWWRKWRVGRGHSLESTPSTVE